MKILEVLAVIFLILCSIWFIVLIIYGAMMVFSELKDMLDDWRKV